VFNDFDSEINVKGQPIEMAREGLLDIENFPYRNIFEPGKILIGHEHLFVSSKQPNPAAGDVRDLNRGALPRRF
jgi:hypothetical protein